MTGNAILFDQLLMEGDILLLPCNGLCWCLRENLVDYEAAGWECPRRSGGSVWRGSDLGSLRYSPRSKSLLVLPVLPAYAVGWQSEPHDSFARRILGKSGKMAVML